MDQARYDKLFIDINVPKSEYASANRFPICEVPCPVGIGVSDNGDRIGKTSVVNLKSGSGLEILKHSLCRHCMHFERFDIVSTESGDAECDVRLTSESCIHERSHH